MEQRTLLAIILSVMVLFVYSALIPRSGQNVDFLKVSQAIENKYLTDKYNRLPKETLQSSLSSEISSFQSVQEKIDLIETDTFLAEFSNLGGKLKKISLKKYAYSPMVRDFITIEGFENVPFQIEEFSRGKITYVFDNNELNVKKTYFFDKFKIAATVSFFNKTKVSKEIGQKIKNFTIDYYFLDKKNLPKNYFTEKTLYEYSIATPSDLFRKNNASSFNEKDKRITSGEINWTGFRDRYFCIIVKPEYETNEAFVNPLNEEILEIKISPRTTTVAPGGVIHLSSLIYVGPQDLKLLKSYAASFDKIMNFKIGGFMDVLTFGLTDIVGKGMLRTLNFTHNLIPNWGICIIILALLVYGVTYPLTLKSISSVKKMQQLQPEIQKIQARNKDNPQKTQKEMMELYKKHRFNPFGGCLPMLLQMPIFVSLYQVLWRSFNFKGANFLWIKDLSEPDRLFVLPYSMPFLGNEINILPFLVMVAMFFQQKNSAKNMVIADPNQLVQQKMMANVLPVIIGFFFYRVASGLALYFTIFYFLSAITQWKMAKQGKMAVLKG